MILNSHPVDLSERIDCASGSVFPLLLGQLLLATKTTVHRDRQIAYLDRSRYTRREPEPERALREQYSGQVRP